jgi:DNA-binding CsgD family transcriptional regulator
MANLIETYTTYTIAGIITSREHDILILRTRGLSQYAVALALDISRSTVRSAERNARQKIERHNRKAA